MAFTVGTDLNQWGSSVTGSTITFTGVDYPALTLLVFGWCANVASLTATCSDNSTQSGSANTYTLGSLMNGTTFTSQAIYCFLTREILSTDTITITLSTTASRTAATGCSFTCDSNNPIFDNATSVRVGASTSPVTTSSSGTLHQASELGVAFSGWKGGAVASGSFFGASQLSSPSTHSESSSGGTVSRVAHRITVGATTANTSGTTSWTYTSLSQVNLRTLFFYEGPVISGAAPATAQSSPRPLRSSPRSTVSGPFDNTTGAPPDSYVQVVASRASVYYRARNTVTSMFGATAPAYAQVVSSRASAPYRARSTVTSMFDPGSAGVFAPTAISRLSGLYCGSYSAVAGVADQALDSWTQVFLSRSVSYYRPPLSLATLALFAPPLTFGSDWASVVMSRAVPFYRAPGSPLVLVPGAPNVIPDTWSSVFTSRAVPFYCGPRALIVPVFDPAADTFADWTPGVIQDRPVLFYSPPRESFATAWGRSVVTDALASVITSRPVAPYRAPLSVAPSVAFVSPPPDTWAASILSRAVRAYGAPRSLVSSADGAALAAAGYAPVVQSRALGLGEAATHSLTVFPDGPTVITYPPQGGGGEWIIWGKPDFPANRGGAWQSFPPMNFRKPTRRVP